MTVKELIAELAKCDGDAPVWTEGCDCWGIAFEVRERSKFCPDVGEEHPEFPEYGNDRMPADAVLILR